VRSSWEEKIQKDLVNGFENDFAERNAGTFRQKTVNIRSTKREGKREGVFTCRSGGTAVATEEKVIHGQIPGGIPLV